MSVLGKKQRKFARDFALLLQYAFALGYEITFPPEHIDHIDNSNHFRGLAKDINLFKDGKYLTKTSDHKPLGDFWKSLGNSWGGDFQDGCHYSIQHEGIK